jgi:hypothetical protein
MRSILSVIPHEYYLICELDNGRTYRYDMGFVLTRNSEMTAPLKDLSFFKRVFIESGSLAWPNGYDIHANTVLRDGTIVQEKSA